MLTVIPVLPLTTEIENYSKSVIKRHLMNNCLQFNQLLLDIRSSLCQLSTLLTGYYNTINNEQLQLLDCLLTNTVPNCWHCPLKLPANVVDLTGYLEILQRVAECMTEYLQLPLTHHNQINITFIPNIAGLLEEFKLYYCKSHNQHAEDIFLSCQVNYCVNQITSKLYTIINSYRRYQLKRMRTV